MDSVWDADVDGNADGLMGVDISVDMEALFRNFTELGLDLDLLVGLLSAGVSLTSDFIPDQSVSLFDQIIPSVDGNDDGFLFGREISFLEDQSLATLFDKEFDLVGWNIETTDIVFDIA